MNFIYYLQYYAMYQKAKFFGYPFIIKLTILFVLTLLLFYCFLLIRILLVNRSRRRFKTMQSRFYSLFNERIKIIILKKEKLDQQALKEYFKNDLSKVKNKREKRAFTYLLINIINDPDIKNTKINEMNYGGIIELFKINEYWDKKLVGGTNVKRHHSLRVLDDLQNGVSGANILRSVYHKDNNLRKHARATLIKYDNNDPYKFLEESFDKDFNSLDEVRLHQNLVRISKENNLPLLMRWVNNSTNEQFKAFIIKEIGFFNQKESADDLVKLLKNESSSRVKCQIIETLGVLDFHAAEGLLIKKYEMSTVAIQTSIIKAVGMLKSVQGLDFLEKIYAEIHDHDTKVLVAKAIKGYGKEGRLGLKKLSQRSSEFDKMIVEQVRYQVN